MIRIKIDLENFGFTNVYKLGDFGGYKGANVPRIPTFSLGLKGLRKSLRWWMFV